MLPTPRPTTTSTQSPPTTPQDVPVWTWWTPASNISQDSKPSSGYEEILTESALPNLFDSEPHSQPWENDEISSEEKLKDEVINNKTTEKVTTVDYTSENTNSDDLENESAGHPNESDKILSENIETSNDIPNREDENQKDMEDEYLELVAHNTRLVDILRTTLELQADLFRRIIRYLFP